MIILFGKFCCFSLLVYKLVVDVDSLSHYASMSKSWIRAFFICWRTWWWCDMKKWRGKGQQARNGKRTFNICDMKFNMLTFGCHDVVRTWTTKSVNDELKQLWAPKFSHIWNRQKQKKTFPKDAIFLLVRHIKLFEINIIRQRGKSVYPDSREREDESCCSLSRFPADELFLNTLRNLLWTFPNSIFTRSIELQNIKLI